MDSIPTPTQVAQRRTVGIGPVSEGHADSLRSFAFFPYRGPAQIDRSELGPRAWADVLTSLAELAETENWTGAANAERSLPILDSFLRYTHKRLVMEDKIVVTPDGEFAATNTGLLTPHAEEIFGLFQRNRHDGAQGWYFLRWVAESDRDLLKNFPEPPQMAEYVT
ncbi:hypothetical protein ASG84_16065 [Rhodococcus sp. Leaf278]|nr:hypothetical protein ASG84_16065 [Rhodococcus sp. Leaf278]